MVVEIEARIRVVAYLLWESRGRPPDSALPCWLEAENAVLSAALALIEQGGTSRSVIPPAARQMHPTTARHWTPGRWP